MGRQHHFCSTASAVSLWSSHSFPLLILTYSVDSVPENEKEWAKDAANLGFMFNMS